MARLQVNNGIILKTDLVVCLKRQSAVYGTGDCSNIANCRHAVYDASSNFYSARTLSSKASNCITTVRRN
jgi:hypothetical protein